MSGAAHADDHAHGHHGGLQGGHGDVTLPDCGLAKLGGAGQVAGPLGAGGHWPASCRRTRGVPSSR